MCLGVSNGSAFRRGMLIARRRRIPLAPSAYFVCLRVFILDCALKVPERKSNNDNTPKCFLRKTCADEVDEIGSTALSQHISVPRNHAYDISKVPFTLAAMAFVEFSAKQCEMRPPDTRLLIISVETVVLFLFNQVGRRHSVQAHYLLMLSGWMVCCHWEKNASIAHANQTLSQKLTLFCDALKCNLLHNSIWNSFFFCACVHCV